MNTPGNSFGELVARKGYVSPWEGGQGLWGKVCVALCHWPWQGCWKMLHLHTQGLEGRWGPYEVKQGIKPYNCQSNEFLVRWMGVPAF